MKFKKVSFEGAINASYSNVNYSNWGEQDSELKFRDDGIWLRGNRIPIRRSLWGAFKNEFVMGINSQREYLILRFHIDSDGGYKVHHYFGNKHDYYIECVVNLGGVARWQSPSLPERK